METIFKNTENSKTNVSHKFILNLPQRSDLRGSNKYLDLQYLTLYYTYSVTDIQDYVEYIIKTHKTLTAIPSISI